MFIPMKIAGLGMALGDKVIDNDWFVKELGLDTSDEWITERTGIKKRYFLSDPDKALSYIGAKSARQALEMAGVKPEDVDLVICATFTPDYQMPATACLIKEEIGAKNAGAYDMQIACSGFVYALINAASMVASGMFKNVLIVAGDVISRFLDFEDRGTCILFGDGAGAALITQAENGEGIFAVEVGADGSAPEKLLIPAGGSARPASEETVKNKEHYLRMNGREIFRFSVNVVPQTMKLLLEKSGLSKEEVDLWILHQANIRIIEAAAKRMGVPMSKMYNTIAEYGNISAGTIPITMYEAYKNNVLKRGSILGLIGFGGGLSWGGLILRF